MVGWKQSVECVECVELERCPDSSEGCEAGRLLIGVARRRGSFLELSGLPAALRIFIFLQKSVCLLWKVVMVMYLTAGGLLQTKKKEASQWLSGSTVRILPLASTDISCIFQGSRGTSRRPCCCFALSSPTWGSLEGKQSTRTYQRPPANLICIPHSQANHARQVTIPHTARSPPIPSRISSRALVVDL